jgi:hypothetical protein
MSYELNSRIVGTRKIVGRPTTPISVEVLDWVIGNFVSFEIHYGT